MIIGLGYKARSGKDTVASYLKEHFGFRQTFFAEPLKEACEVIFRLTKDQLYGDQKFDPVPFWWDMTTREILQKFWRQTVQVIARDIPVECVCVCVHKDMYICTWA